MNALNLFFRRAFVAAAFTLCFVWVEAADSSELGQSAGTVSVPAGASRIEVRDAIVSALIARGWDVTSKTDDRVVGYLKHRANEATLTMIYDETKVDLFCVGWQIHKKTGAREKPEQPTGWLKYIKEDLNKFLKRVGTNK